MYYYFYNSCLTPEILHGKVHHRNHDLQFLDGAVRRAGSGPLHEPLSGVGARRLGLRAHLSGRCEKLRRTCGRSVPGAPPHVAPRAFPLVISAVQVTVVVVRGCGRLRQLFWEKSRAPPHGAELPT